MTALPLSFSALPSSTVKTISDAIGTSTSGSSPIGKGTVLAPTATTSPTTSIQSSGGDILTAVQVDPKVLALAQAEADKKAAEEKAKKEEEAKKKRNLYILGGVGVVGVVALAFYMSNRD